MKSIIPILALAAAMACAQEETLPTVTTQPTTSAVTVVESRVVTQQVGVVRSVVLTNATLRQFRIYYGNTKRPTRLLAVFSDDSVIDIPAGDVTCLTNRNVRNRLLDVVQEVTERGTRVCPTNRRAP